jgi:hypothetical protein
MSDGVCRVCSGANVETVLDLGDQPHCNSLLLAEQLGEKEPYYPLRLGFCHDCTTVQIDHTVPKETMFGEYLYVSGTTRTLREHFADSAGRLKATLELQPGDLVVDIGSNDGTWLAEWQKLGMSVLGVEPAKNIAAQANAAGIPTVNDFFNADVARQTLEEHGAPKLVTAAGVFFHLEELHSATEGVAEFCRAGATFCVQAIYLGEMLRNNEFDNIYHEHLTYWTVRSIGELFKRHGLEVFSANLVPIHGGTLELLVGAEGANEIQPSVGEFRAREDELGYGEIETYRRFADKVWEMRDGLLGILRDFKEQGKTVHAFGAPAKGATLLNSFGITTELVPEAEEKNPLKVGRWIPGARIPIVDEDSVETPPDAYLILPWNFLGEFLKFRRDYILGGGAFIVPVPVPTVIDASNYAEHASSE